MLWLGDREGCGWSCEHTQFILIVDSRGIGSREQPVEDHADENMRQHDLCCLCGRGKFRQRNKMHHLRETVDNCGKY